MAMVWSTGVSLGRNDPDPLLQLLIGQAGGFDDIIKKLVDSIPPEVRVESPGKFKIYLHIRLAVINGNRLIYALEGNPP